jgi:catechol 2,3-dioxygenase-like lactoylglutathione lyase family enzyme
MTRGPLHHVELWVPDLARATSSIGWLLGALGYQAHQNWDRGRSWRLGDTYIVIEQSLALTGEVHDRLRAGLNHLAFHAGSITELDGLIADAVEHGWTLLFPDLHPYAGGTEHYAGYLSDTDGFEVELVATTPKGGGTPTP